MLKENWSLTQSQLQWIYFIQSEAPPHLVKIGRTQRHPSARLSGMQTDSPVGLHPVLLLRGMHFLETAFHLIFLPYHRHGEWFAAKGELARFVLECRQQKVDYFGPELADQMLRPLIRPEIRERIEDCIAAIESSHEDYARRFPWIRKRRLENVAMRML